MTSLKLACEHPWDLTPEQAVQLQQELRQRVWVEPLPLAQVRTVGGVDVGFCQDQARAAAVVLDFPSLQVLEQQVVERPLSFPYIPGLLSFREAPVILAALEQLSALPDVILCDGHGFAHPRRMGIASHLGILLDHPTVGCAKSVLVGHHGDLGETRGRTTPLYDDGEIIGELVRTRDYVKPVIVSIGQRVDLPSAVELILACGSGYRLPQPIRLADRLASRRGW